NRVVLGMAAAADVDPRFANPPRGSPVRIGNEVNLKAYSGHIGSIEAIDKAAAGRGLINSGPGDQVVRQVPYIVMVQGVAVPTLAIETLRVALESPPLTIARDGALAQMRFGEVRTTLQPDGSAWIRFGPHDASRFVSADDVLSGRLR